MGTLATAGSKETAAFYNQYYGFGDATSTTVTAAVQTPLTTSFTIPGGEPQAGSAYEVVFGGTGTWGSTAQALTFTLVLQGVVILNDISGVAAGAFNTGITFRFQGRAEVVYQGSGASTTVNSGMYVCLTEQANAVGLFTAATNTVPLADSRIVSGIDATSNAALVVKCAWAATTGAPTITNQHTIFRKVA